MFAADALGLLLCAAIQFANRRGRGGRGTGSLAYASSIAVAAGLGVPQTMLLANALMCSTVAGAA